MKKIYIIGGNGFIGKNIVKILSSKYRITVFDKDIDNKYFASYDTVQTERIDLTRNYIPQNYVTPHFILNLVSIVNTNIELSSFVALIESNVKVLINLFERFKNDSTLRLFVQFGSAEEYGNISSPFHEKDREIPNSPYSLIKQLTTNTAIMLYDIYHFPSFVVRPVNLFGAFQDENKIIPYLIKKLKNNEDIYLSNCEQKRDFIHINYFIEILDRIIQKPENIKGKIINVGSGKSVALKEIIELLKKHTNSKSNIFYGAIPHKKNEIMNLNCNIDELNSVINIKKEVDVKSVIIDFINEQENVK